MFLRASRLITRMSSVPGCKVFWNASVEDIKKRADVLIESSRNVYDEIGKLDNKHATFQSVIEKMSVFEAQYHTERNMLDFYQHVSPDKDLREASTVADKEISKVEVELSMRKDVFEKFLLLSNTIDNTVDAECKRYIERKIKLGKRNGLHLSQDIQDEIAKILTRISDLGIDFSKNLGEENSHLLFTEEELDGCPKDFIESLEKVDGKCKVTLKYPHYFPSIKKARNPETRRQLENAFNSRCMKENAAILEELIELREKKSKILGFATHADFVLDMRMAKSAKTVADFLNDLAQKMKPLLEKEFESFLKFKKEECEKYGFTFNGRLDMWDMRYFMNMAEERDYSVDHELLKNYFPIEVVSKGLLDIYQKLLNLTFTQVETDDVWHPDVTMYKVVRNDDENLLGYFYLDLHPREGKYGHAAVFPIQPGCLAANPHSGDTERQVAVVAMVANFSKPTADKPALFTHDEVETFFHEFGHVMHQLCATANYSIFSGTSVERDFVECPSQMLENWCWEVESLRLMSKHYKDGSPIPDDLLQSLLKSRVANAGIFNMRQILLGTFDQTIHTGPRCDTAKVYDELSQKLLGIESSPNTNMPATFGHLAGGYDASYYGYLWSEVFSADMFATRFKKEGVLNPKTGVDYRDKILKPGGTKDGIDMLKDFLGREPNQDAFLKMKGL